MHLLKSAVPLLIPSLVHRTSYHVCFSSAQAATRKTAGIIGIAQNFIIHNVPKEAKDIEFISAKGGPGRLSAFRGKLVLLNFWATWCAPCRREMPDLDLLQKGLGGAKFHVLALSTDRQGLPRIAEFYQQMKLKNLEQYAAKNLQVTQAYRVLGLPVTILISPEGKEIGRMVGPADWNSPPARALISFYLPKG